MMHVLMASDVIYQLDKLASQIQSEGHTRIASYLDVIANTLESQVADTVSKAVKEPVLDKAEQALEGKPTRDLINEAMETIRGKSREELNEALDELNSASHQKAIEALKGFSSVMPEKQAALSGLKMPLAAALLVLGLTSQGFSQDLEDNQTKTEMTQQDLSSIVEEAINLGFVPQPSSSQMKALSSINPSWDTFINGLAWVDGFSDMIEDALSNSKFRSFLKNKFSDSSGKIDKQKVSKFFFALGVKAIESSPYKQAWKEWAKKQGKSVRDLGNATAQIAVSRLKV
jgi:hypothetical protein